jgi:Domain of unknown function (DUF4365)
MARRKKRVRNHVIADMSLHHVGYEVVKHGFTIEAESSDYGYDCSIVTFDTDGEVENGMIFLQLKATEGVKRTKGKATVSFRVDRRDLDYWENEIFPVYLILFDAVAERAYWLYVQRYVQDNHISAARLNAGSLTVHIDLSQVVDGAAVARWREDKAAVLAQIGPVDHA